MTLMTFYWTLAPPHPHPAPVRQEPVCGRVGLAPAPRHEVAPGFTIDAGVLVRVRRAPTPRGKPDLHQAGLGVVAGHVAHAPARSVSEGGCDLAGSPGVGVVARRLAGRRTP